MMTDTYSAFDGTTLLATGTRPETAAALHAAMANAAAGPLLLFRHQDGAVVDLDLRGSLAETLARLEAPAPAPARGRPKLGVVAREVTLLPRHWDWLATQPGGASVALRKLVDAARRDDAGERRQRRDAGYRFMAAIAGDLPGFEAASRALFAADKTGLSAAMSDWPAGIRAVLTAIAGDPA
ncbi:MAG: hypothetical protein CFE37_01960 [Alphaproteobacteria bacterium PA4]|nr:MAG: hypothetical protein CFE37_01960 [Alphaproteobacteria bacterium PA4]